MNISFKNPEDESKFKEFVCKQKDVIKTFLAFGTMMKNPIVRVIFSALSALVDAICPE